MKNNKRDNNLKQNLLVTWSLGLFSGICLYFAVLLILASLLGGIATFSNPEPNLYYLILSIVAFVSAFFFAPAILGIYWSGYKLGITKSIVALIISPFALWLGWLGESYLPNLIVTLLGISVSFLRNYFNFLIPTATSFAAIITIIIFCTPKFSKRMNGSIIGVIIGFLVSALIELIYRNNILRGDMIFNLFWIIPPLVWVTVVYFIQRARGYTSWQGLATWLGLVAFTFVLPFVMYQTPLWLFR